MANLQDSMISWHNSPGGTEVLVGIVALMVAYSPGDAQGASWHNSPGDAHGAWWHNSPIGGIIALASWHNSPGIGLQYIPAASFETGRVSHANHLRLKRRSSESKKLMCDTGYHVGNPSVFLKQASEWDTLCRCLWFMTT